MKALVSAIVCCAVLAEPCRASELPFSQRDPALTVMKDGNGGGKVESGPAGIACGTACVHVYSSGTAVTLTATPDAGSVFVGWTGGGCSGANTCQVVLSAATTVTATFLKASTGPFTVKQTESLGGETLSGSVCDVTKPFAVLAATKRVAWTFKFTPNSATSGAVGYTYSIPSAGESHNATGTYRLSQPAPDGTLVLSLAVSDRVVFKGFDGPIPLRYKFSLVPSVSCQ